MTGSAPRLRLDKWLWFARFVKTRTLAQGLCASGHVTVNGTAVHKASATIKIGDEVILVLGKIKRFLQVQDLGSRRGPAPEAQLLYSELKEPEHLGGAIRNDWEQRPKGDGRPTKKDRRAVDRLREPLFDA
jgi:ribosome-associated heat shock protein Hsp15